MIIKNKSQHPKENKPCLQGFFAHNISRSFQRIYQYLHQKRDKHFRVKVTHQQVMWYADVSRKTVQRAMKLFEELGWIHIQRTYLGNCENDPNIYIIENENRNQEFLDFLDIFFKNLMFFGSAFLLSNTRLAENDTPLLLERYIETKYGIYFHKLPKEERSFKKLFLNNRTSSRDQEPIERTIWTTSLPGTQEANKKERVSMHPFTQEQLVELAHYPQDILEYAMGTLKGKSIENQFSWVKKVCENQIRQRADGESQPPFERFSKYQNGKAKVSRSTVSATEIQQQRNLQHERYQRFMESRKDRLEANLVSKGIDPRGLSEYQISLALKGKPYKTEDILKEIESSKIKSVEIYRNILEKTIKKDGQ